MLKRQVISRSAAYQARMERYYTGEPCPLGHLSQRYTSTYACIACTRIRDRERYAKRSRPAKGVPLTDGRRVRSRSAALTVGELRYFTGTPCAQGHLAERRVSNTACVECSLQRNNKRRKRHAIPFWKKILRHLVGGF